MSGKKTPPFIPKPGQVDFHNVRWAPVVNCVVMYQGNILLVQRNERMNFYPGYWNGISGFLDDHRSLEEKVTDELREEIGIIGKHIASIQLCDVFDQEEPKYGKTWIVHAVLVQVTTDAVTLDWEAERFVWVDPAQATDHQLLPGFDRVLSCVLRHMQGSG